MSRALSPSSGKRYGLARICGLSNAGTKRYAPRRIVVWTTVNPRLAIISSRSR
jgi:hypothetical protein